jgi:hypothetical protein
MMVMPMVCFWAMRRRCLEWVRRGGLCGGGGVGQFRHAEKDKIGGPLRWNGAAARVSFGNIAECGERAIGKRHLVCVICSDGPFAMDRAMECDMRAKRTCIRGMQKEEGPSALPKSPCVPPRRKSPTPIRSGREVEQDALEARPID